MSKSIILSDREIATNEDVSNLQAWRRQDLDRYLEGKRFGTTGSTVSSLTAAGVVSGLSLYTYGDEPKITVLPGQGFFGFPPGDLDPSYPENTYQVCSLDESVSVSIKTPSSGMAQWYIVEATAVREVAQEVRNFVPTTGYGITLSPMTTDKVRTNKIQIAVRAGVVAAAADATIPSLNTSASWTPLYAIRVTDVASAYWEVYDLRLWTGNFRRERRRHLISSASTSSWVTEYPRVVRKSDSVLSVSRVAVGIQNYEQEIDDSAVWGGTTTNPFVDLDINAERPSSVTLEADRWFYLYAVRPNYNSGLTVLTYSNKSPIDTGGFSPDGLSLPPVWASAPSFVTGCYLGAFRVYELGGGSWGIKEFSQAGNYNTITGIADGAPSGADLNNQAHNASTPTIGSWVDFGINDSGPIIPAHSKMVKTRWLVNSSGASVIDVGTENHSVVSHLEMLGSGDLVFILDIPLPDGYSVDVAYKLSGVVHKVNVEVLGYYEDFS